MLAYSLRLYILVGCTIGIAYCQSGNHTTCADSGLDWYTSVIGETPCTTYQRLRQICNPTYQVPLLNKNTSNPPDFCDDQIPSCCCNSVSFALSMLCLNCQQGVGDSGAGNGYDAPTGTYQEYIANGHPSFCSPNTNRSLPSNIQASVCNNNIRIFDDIYTRSFWNDGSWFYKWTSEDATLEYNANQTFTRCENYTVTTTNSSSSSASQATGSGSGSSTSSSGLSSSGSSSTSAKLNTAAIVGAAIGSVFFTLGVIGIIALFIVCRRRRAARQAIPAEPYVTAPNSGPEAAMTSADPLAVPLAVPPAQNQRSFPQIRPRKYAAPELRTNANDSTQGSSDQGFLPRKYYAAPELHANTNDSGQGSSEALQPSENQLRAETASLLSRTFSEDCPPAYEQRMSASAGRNLQ